MKLEVTKHYADRKIDQMSFVFFYNQLEEMLHENILSFKVWYRDSLMKGLRCRLSIKMSLILGLVLIHNR